MDALRRSKVRPVGTVQQLVDKPGAASITHILPGPEMKSQSANLAAFLSALLRRLTGVWGPWLLAMAAGSLLSRDAQAQVALYEWVGNFAGDELGVSVASLGDVDGDGVGDLALGSTRSTGGILPGYALTVSGATGSILFVHNHYTASTSFGRQVCRAGDLDSDGHADIAIWDEASHSISLFSGANGSVIGELPFTEGALFMSMDGGEDVDGDGIPDIAYTGGGQYLGKLVVASGATFQTLMQLEAPWLPEWGCVALLGDLNGDNRSEIGAQYASGNDDIIRVWSGSDGSQLFTRAVPGGSITTQLVRLGDVNQDGTPDLVYAGLGTQTVILSGADGTTLRTLIAGELFSRKSLAVIGDLDGDGTSEIACGLTTGTLSGEVRIFSGQSGVELMSLADPDGTSSFGFSIASPGDVNGDGLAELAVGAPRYDSIYADHGRASLWSTTSCVAERYCVTSPNTVGPGATISHSGSLSISNNTLSLVTSGCPPHQPGIYFYGSYPSQIPFGDGYRCVAGLVLRFTAAITSDSAGVATDQLDFSMPPFDSGSGAISPGSAWRFQYWYRDPVAVGAGWNLSDAIQLTFCP